MNKSLLCFLLLCISLGASSQKVYFLYLQTEREQPFFIKMNEKVQSSTGAGYLILSKLADSTYSFSIGFPQNKWPEQKFSVALKGKDHGFLIKDFGEKGWGLFDLQTLSIIMGTTDAKKTSSRRMEKTEVTEFTAVLARASDDSTLLERPMVMNAVVMETVKPQEPVNPKEPAPTEKKEETKAVATQTANTVKEEPVMAETVPGGKKGHGELVPAAGMTEAGELPATKTDAKPENKTEPKTENKEVKTDPVKDQKPLEAEYKPSVITRGAVNQGAEGTEMVFIDVYGAGAKDTIRITIANPPQIALANDQSKQQKKFLDIGTEVDSVKPVQGSVESVIPAVTETKSAHKNNCSQVATETDFLKLRKKMAAETDDDDMVDEARKYFKTKCFTTVQIKNLGALFLDDLGKYKFYSMAYLFVSDAENFSSLQSEFKKEYYLKRFQEVVE
jgi:hypothetical protein